MKLRQKATLLTGELVADKLIDTDDVDPDGNVHLVKQLFDSPIVRVVTVGLIDPDDEKASVVVTFFEENPVAKG